MNKQWKCWPAAAEEEGRISTCFRSHSRKCLSFWFRNFPDNAIRVRLWQELADGNVWRIVCLFAYRKFESQIWKSMKNGELADGLCFLYIRETTAAVVDELFRSWSIHIEITRSAWHVPAARPFPKIRDEQTHSPENPGGDWCWRWRELYRKKQKVIQRERNIRGSPICYRGLHLIASSQQ